MESPSEYSGIGYPSFVRPKAEQKIVLPETVEGETPEEYLEQIGRVKIAGGGDIIAERTLIKKLVEILQELKKNEDSKHSKNKQRNVLDRLQNAIAPFPVKAPTEDEDKTEYYQTLPPQYRTRGFLEVNQSAQRSGSVPPRPYAKMLFGLSRKFLNYPESDQYVKEIIDGKKIALLGGADSVHDLLTSNQYMPKEIINIDPYMQTEAVGKNDKGVYRSVLISAADPKLIAMNRNGELPKFDEIWAMYSVPCYLVTSKEIRDLFRNVTALLAPGGNARIAPLSVQATDIDLPESYGERKKMFLKAVADITKSPGFNVTVAADVLKIHRIKKRESER